VGCGGRSPRGQAGGPRPSRAGQCFSPPSRGGIISARYTAVNKATGKALNVRVAHHFVVRSGQIVRFEQFVDTARVGDAMNPGTGDAA